MGKRGRVRRYKKNDFKGIMVIENDFKGIVVIEKMKG